MKRLSLFLLIGWIAACAGAPATRSVTPVPAPATATAAAAPHSPNALTPAASVTKTIAEPRIRVGMLTDQPSITFPRIADGYYIITDAGSSTLRRGFTDAAPVHDVVSRYAVQVASLSDRPSADAFVARLRTETGQRADALFDPSASNGGMYRILAGDFPDERSAQPFRDQLLAKGYGRNDMIIVRRPSDQPFEARHEITDDEGDHYTIAGQSILIIPVSADTIRIGEKPYRSAARVFINARGTFNIINELNLEDYLKGVVPAEMGPSVYDELEGLKAQAVAARTYAVRNLNGFRREGFDICPGPACQAYNGFSGEAALSNQAVAQTAGLVMTYNGQIIDALFTSTCGGETSDVGVMFPGRTDPYLKRARCVEMEMTSLAGRADSAMLTDQQVNARLFAALAGVPESGTSWSAREVVQAVNAAARMLQFGGSVTPSMTAAAPATGQASTTSTVAPPVSSTAAALTVSPPPSSRRGDVLAYLATLFGFGGYGGAVTLPEDRKYFFPQSSDDSVPYRAAAFLVKYGFLPAEDIDRIDLSAAMPREELYGLLGSWLRKHETINDVTGKIQAIDGRRIALKAEGKSTSYTLPDGIPLFRRLGDRYQEYRQLPVMIGDRAVLQLDSRKRPVAMTLNANIDGASFDRTSSFANWTRSYRSDELVTSINKRYPIQQLIDLTPLTVDASQRVAELQVTAEGGRTFVLRGLPLRWSLNLPDNLFVYDRTRDADGVDRYTFYGKGWGHGVGMCQVGAYGMAFRGKKFDEILKRYYTGIEIVPMAQAQRPAVPPPAPTPASP